MFATVLVCVCVCGCAVYGLEAKRTELNREKSNQTKESVKMGLTLSVLAMSEMSPKLAKYCC